MKVRKEGSGKDGKEEGVTGEERMVGAVKGKGGWKEGGKGK